MNTTQHDYEATLAGHKPKLCSICQAQRKANAVKEKQREARGVPHWLIVASDSVLVRHGFDPDGFFGTH